MLLLAEHKTRVFTEILEMLRWFAGQQIRNVAVCRSCNVLMSDACHTCKQANIETETETGTATDRERERGRGGGGVDGQTDRQTDRFAMLRYVDYVLW